MMEIKTEPNQSYELNVDGENENMVDNNSMECVSDGKMHLYLFKYVKFNIHCQLQIKVLLLKEHYSEVDSVC